MAQIEFSQSEDDATFILQKLAEYDRNFVPASPPETLNLIVRQQNTLIAGLVGGTYWNWLTVDLLWVAENERNRGLGTQLLARAEEIAVQRGCKNAHLETHDFQNLAFYLKRGYGIYAELEGRPEGHTEYYLRKHLIQEGVDQQDKNKPS